MDYQLKGKVALVTGVSRKKGIGAAICKALAAEGANIFTTYFRPYDQKMPWGNIENEASEIINDLKNLGVKAQGIEEDLRNPNASVSIFNAAEKTMGNVDILVNNA